MKQQCVSEIRSDWSIEEIQEIHDAPLLSLVRRAGDLLRRFHQEDELQLCSLISIKTGGCPENCTYCAQSSRYQTSVHAEPLLSVEETVSRAKEAVRCGAQRVCLGAAWRGVREGHSFNQVLQMVREISALGVEVCCTLGLLNAEQARALKEAGLHSYNHNLDTSEEQYKSVVTTRTYEDRLRTLSVVDRAGLHACCGGILGLGEKSEDRVALIHTLATRVPHPTSVPINLLMPMEGTPLANQPPVPIWETMRVIATARIAMPLARVRLSAGRLSMSLEQQALCFLAGANSIFVGDKLLTAPNPKENEDHQMMELFGFYAKTS